MKNRSELREVVMKVIYQVLILKQGNLDLSVDMLIHEQLDIENDFVRRLVYGILDHYDDIVKLVDQSMKDWEMKRLNKVDQAILLLGVYELLYTETPSIVAINEAIEISKRYSDEKVTKMVNAVLDSIYKNYKE